MSTGSEVSSNRGGSSREEQLQSHVAQLTEDLDREKREIKTVREKEQENASQQLESVTTKPQKDKAQELKVSLLLKSSPGLTSYTYYAGAT
jgi:carbonic anhydrase